MEVSSLPKTIVKVDMASCGIAAGAEPVYSKLQSLLDGNSEVELKKVGCIGFCYMEPLVEIEKAGRRVTYGEVDVSVAEKIVKQHVENNELLKENVILDTSDEASENFRLDTQVRIVLRNTGLIDPQNINEYLERDGYNGLKKAIKDMSPMEVIQEILDSGLRGRGGAGFPTGLKWKFAHLAKSDKKYFVCNADEGDPGAFMDRSVLEGDPHSVIEGMAIGGYAIGADEGIIYCRAEYPLAIKHLNTALDQAREKGYLGNNIMGTDFSFDIHIKEGAGAFVCGEETAMIASIEGKRGMPRPRPPFPANSGIWGKPTNINNVETLANIAWIISNGSAEFSKYGIGKSRGTKVFALAGKINKGGLAEVPMGMPLKDVIYKIAGGIPGDKKFKAVQLGGPSGGCVPAELLDTPVDYESINATGAIMGSGGMVVMDQNTCMVEVARYFLSFTQKESCGKCTFCRLGTLRMLEVLERITAGEGREGDLEELEHLAEQIKGASLCGLGQTAPNPVLTTLKYFRHEYEAHIKDRQCPALNCKKLVTYSVDPEKCTGCTVCAKNCPSNAIDGERKQVHFIRQDACIKCGMCYTKCKFDAIVLS